MNENMQFVARNSNTRVKILFCVKCGISDDHHQMIGVCMNLFVLKYH